MINGSYHCLFDGGFNKSKATIVLSFKSFVFVTKRVLSYKEMMAAIVFIDIINGSFNKTMVAYE